MDKMYIWVIPVSIILTLLFTVLTGKIATGKGHSAGWYVFGFFFGLIGVIAALCLSDVSYQETAMHSPTWKCPKCGKANPISDSFCPECGEKAAYIDASGWKCESCGAINEKSAKFCKNCGKPSTVPLVQEATASPNSFGYRKVDRSLVSLEKEGLKVNGDVYELKDLKDINWVGASVYVSFSERKFEVVFQDIYHASAFLKAVQDVMH